MKKNKGFTLVELLAVIVILAIIMLIAIPAVLNTLESARKKTFLEFATKSFDSTVKASLNEQINNSIVESCVIYNIQTDLGMNNTGDYKGYVLVVNEGTDQKYYLVLYDNDYIIGPVLYNDENINVNKFRKVNNVDDEKIKESLALTGECITYTNKKDGSIGTSIPDDGISRVLKVEDYVHYYPSISNYSFDDSLTGCADTDECGVDTINPSNAKLWMVSSVNDDGTVTLVGKSSELIKLWGITGYQNGVYVLREAASKYNDNRYAKSVKALGYNGQEDRLKDEDMTEIRNSKENRFILDSAIKKYGTEDELYYDEVYAFPQKIRFFMDGSFITSRDIIENDPQICIRRIWMNGSGMFTTCAGAYNPRYPLLGFKPGCTTGDYGCKFMNPINVSEGYNAGYVGVVVTLKANVRIASGKGTSSEPYELTF